MSELLTAREVADRLGVELATVYAYASRGSLTRVPDAEGRRSRYDADEVEALARRARPRSTRRRIGAVDVVIGTTVSEIGDGWIRYRDHDLLDLAGWASFEDVCALLWTGDLEGAPTEHDAGDDRDRAQAMAAVAQVARAMPPSASVSARLAAGAAAASPWVPRASDEAGAVRSAGLVLDALITALPRLDRDGAVDAEDLDGLGGVAGRLWPRLTARAAGPAEVRALDRTLVLLAEHELATSTFAVRVAASTRAKPAEAVLAGLGTMSGPFHGRAAVRVHRRMAEGLGPVDHSPLAGFGHTVHVSGDPRFAPALEAARSIAAPDRLAVIDAYVAPARGEAPPNVDAAIGALGYAAEMPPGATEALFAVARTAGWLAHAFEEADEAPVRYRGRTLYRGPR